jgi:DNA-binding transcriptional ArsR family regulator
MRMYEGSIARYEAAGDLFRALASPVRLAIVDLLITEPRVVHQLVELTGIAQPLVSQHLRVLRQAGVVRGVRQSREIAYALLDEHVAHIVRDALAHGAERFDGPPEQAVPATG